MCYSLFEAISRCEELARLHGIEGYTFLIKKRLRRSLGRCNDEIRRIELSYHFVSRFSREEVDQTILHELAHAKAGCHHNHDEVWVATAKAMGVANPQPCSSVVRAHMLSRWIADCRCNYVPHWRNRRPRRGYSYRCNVCLEPLAWRRSQS